MTGHPTLTETDVLDIWHRLAAGQPVRHVAAHYKVTASAIGAIKGGRHWKHVDPGPLRELARAPRCRNGHLRAEHTHIADHGRTRCRACKREARRRRPEVYRKREQAWRARRHQNRHAGHEIRTRSNGTTHCLTCWRGDNDIDQAAVDRAVAGRPPAYMSYAERHAAILTLANKGLTRRQIAQTVGVCIETVDDHRAAARRAAA